MDSVVVAPTPAAPLNRSATVHAPHRSPLTGVPRGWRVSPLRASVAGPTDGARERKATRCQPTGNVPLLVENSLKKAPEFLKHEPRQSSPRISAPRSPPLFKVARPPHQGQDKFRSAFEA